jgi:hypothetical protein
MRWHRISRASPRVAPYVVAALFVIGALYGLDRTPRVNEDEPWFVAAGEGLLRTGRFGMALFRGYFGAEERAFMVMPVVPVLDGIAVRALGLGLWQGRVVSVLLALVTLLATHAAAVRLVGRPFALVAMLVLAAWPVTVPALHFATGIPLSDLARVTRPDIGVAALGMLLYLAALRLFRPEEADRPSPEPPRPWRARLPFVGLGLLGGLTVLAHLHGVFWSVAVGIAALATAGRRAWRALPWAALGFVLAMSPWLAAALSHTREVEAQWFNYQNRLGLTGIAFYLSNLVHEPYRYRFVAGALRRGPLPWLWGAGCAAGLFAAWRARRTESAWQARWLLIPLAVLTLSAALFLQNKTAEYLAPLWPLWAITVAFGARWLWEQARAPWARRAIVAVLAVATAAGGARAAWTLAADRHATPFATFTARVSALIPGGCRVMGMQHYWAGLAGRFPDYRTLFVPIARMSSQFTPAVAPSFEAAVADYPPDVLLIDRFVRPLMGPTPERPTAPAAPAVRFGASLQAYLARGQIIGTVDDPSYGRLDVYQMRPCPGGS